MKSSLGRSVALVFVWVTLATGMAREVFAQGEPADVSEVVVTASRAAPSGFTAPTPTTVVSSQALETQNVTNIGTFLDDMPAFKGDSTPGSNGVRTQAPGAAIADLRGLGAQRTLVLVNGMRMVPEAPVNTTGVTISPDMNQIPSLLIDRVEVVTGGASAQWGSDAVSGVVNILLKDKFQGFEIKAQGSESQLGDSAEARVGMLAGTTALDGRFSIVGGADFVDNKGMGDLSTREWGRQNYQIATNPCPPNTVVSAACPGGPNGQAAQILAPGIVPSKLAPGGLIVGPASFPLTGQYFLPGGTLAPFVTGRYVGGTFMVGGQGQNLATGTSLEPAVRRFDPYVHTEYALQDNLTVFLEASYSVATGESTQLPGRTNITISNTDAYLPAPVLSAMNAANVSSFTLGRLDYDIGSLGVKIQNDTPHVALGLKGSFGHGWSWDAHYGWGENTYKNYSSPDIITANLAFAANAVNNNGQIVCAATIPGAHYNPAASGCVPINVFGSGSPSAAAIDYVTGQSYARSRYTQQSAAANLRGSPVNTWAGPLSVATGLEYRKESEVAGGDPIGITSGYLSSNSSAWSGQFDVAEAYVETVVPLAADLPGAQALDFNGAAREAHYSDVGDQTTWKVGLNYQPFAPAFRLRATRSKDIRAPALFELYSPGALSTQTVSVRGFNAIIPTNLTLGNPNLRPEAATTTTAGILWSPAGSGLHVSLDYFDIDIRQAISSLDATSSASLCNIGVAAYCNAFTFNPVTGAPTSLTLGTVNAASVEQRGVDGEVAYRHAVSPWGWVGPANLDVALNATYVRHVFVNTGALGATTIDRAGENSQQNLYSMPRLRSTLTTTYGMAQASVTAQVVFTSSGTIDNTFNTEPLNTINDNHVPAVTYLNLFGSYNVGSGDHLTLSAGIMNVFDKAPPPVPNTTLLTATNGDYYDIVGRLFQLGVTYKY